MVFIYSAAWASCSDEFRIWQKPVTDTFIVIGARAGSKVRAIYGLTGIFRDPGCQCTLFWLHTLTLAVHNTAEAGDKGHAREHASAQMERLVTAWWYWPARGGRA